MRGRSRHRRPRGLTVGMGLLLLPIGVAHLAQNTVDPSYVGESEAQVVVETQLAGGDTKVNVAQEGGKDYYHFIDLKAQLTHDGQAINGEPIVFTADGVTICTGTTDTNALTHGQGLATCNAKVSVDSFADVPTTFEATFAGDPPLEKSSTEGALTVVGDNNGVGKD